MSAGPEPGPRAATAAAVLLATLAFVACREPRPEPAAIPPSPPGASDAALAESVDAFRARRQWGEALPLLGRLERLEKHRSPVLQIVLATTLHNAALEGRVIEGVPIAATRSAVERVEMERDALRRYERAEADSADLGFHSRIAALRGGLLVSAGLVRDGFEEYLRAQALAPLTPEAVAAAAAVRQGFDDPTRAQATTP